MVSVLALDSAGNACSAAALTHGRIRARRFAAMARGQAEALVPMIAAVLDEAALALAAFDLIAVTTGPGAFTGVRIGLAAARGLALASGLPLLGITSFAAVAAQVTEEQRHGRSLVVALDSKRPEVYLQSFAESGAALGDGRLVAPADWAGVVPAGALLLAGDGAPRLAAALAPRAPALAPGGGLADAADIARLAAAAWRPGLRPPPPRPLYLRPPDTTAPHRNGVRP
jgi:tRNA threonylcarbamoyladenosine biosynthesis protein TsaB